MITCNSSSPSWLAANLYDQPPIYHSTLPWVHHDMQNVESILLPHNLDVQLAEDFAAVDAVLKLQPREPEEGNR